MILEEDIVKWANRQGDECLVQVRRLHDFDHIT